MFTNLTYILPNYKKRKLSIKNKFVVCFLLNHWKYPKNVKLRFKKNPHTIFKIQNFRSWHVMVDIRIHRTLGEQAGRSDSKIFNKPTINLPKMSNLMWKYVGTFFVTLDVRLPLWTFMESRGSGSNPRPLPSHHHYQLNTTSCECVSPILSQAQFTRNCHFSKFKHDIKNQQFLGCYASKLQFRISTTE